LSTNLYVGNLPFTTSAEQLEALFAQHGAVVRAQVVSDRETGRSRGFGFVEMENDESAQAAVSALNGQDYNGRKLNVNVARERSR
jgi:RNA recognition motif-containing protein